MKKREISKLNNPNDSTKKNTFLMNMMSKHTENMQASTQSKSEMLQVVSFLENLSDELEDTLDVFAQNPYFRMSLHLIRGHLEAKVVTPSSLISASGVPYATATRRIKEMTDEGLIELRPRTKTGKSFSMHPSSKQLEIWVQLANRVQRIGTAAFGGGEINNPKEYFYGDSYQSAATIPPIQVLPQPLKISGGIRVLVHGDPTFMVMENLKRQFEQVIGTQIHQRAFSIDRLREEAIKNSQRKISRYDIIAVDLPWVGGFAESGVLMPLDEAMDIAQIDPADFHTAGWKANFWNGRPYGVPSQTTPELLFYRKDKFAEEGLEPPKTTTDLLEAARYFHKPNKGQYGIAWNAARGTALGHTFLMTLADFGQPVVTMPEIAGGFDTDSLSKRMYRPQLDTDVGLQALEFLSELLKYSPPDILSMSWYERIRPYAAGTVPLAYGYTLLAPYFELDPSSPACANTGYLPHPAAPDCAPVAPVGGYMMGIPANLPEDRIPAAIEALKVFTSPQAQKMFVQNGSRTNPRYSVGNDPEVRRVSTIFEAVDGMSWRDELQFWPRPPVPEISDIIKICGEEFHDMLRGIVPPREALRRAQSRADALMEHNGLM